MGYLDLHLHSCCSSSAGTHVLYGTCTIAQADASSENFPISEEGQRERESQVTSWAEIPWTEMNVCVWGGEKIS